MKRINPNTGEPFKRYEEDPNGKIFWCYRSDQKSENGFFNERWIEKTDLNRVKNLSKTTTTQHFIRPFGRAKKLLNAARKRAIKKKLEFSLDIHDILPQLEIGTCQLTGLSFQFEQTNKFHKHPFSPSIDRINSKKGYTKDNIRIILSSLNIALSEYGEDHLIMLVKAMENHNKNGNKTEKIHI